MSTDTVNLASKTGSRTGTSFSRHLPTAGRILLGLIFFIFGLNGFLNFVPPPPTPMPAGAVAFAGAMMKTGYLFQMVTGTQVIVGLLLLSNWFVPLALALIAPVVVNILAFHAFLAPAGFGPGVVVTVLEMYLVWTYRKAYLPMLAMRAEPNRA